MFKVIEYTPTTAAVKMEVETPTDGKSVRISKPKFYQWLRQENRLDRELSFTGVGTMTLEEYWKIDDAYIKVDLHDYIMKNQPELVEGLLNPSPLDIPDFE